MSRILIAAAGAAILLAGVPALAQRGPQGPQTREAFLASQKERFAAMDTNHDGIVTRDEVRAEMASRMDDEPPAAMVDRMFGMTDSDGDGKATAAEAEAAADARFTAMDADHDGTVTPEERRAAMGGMMRRN